MTNRKLSYFTKRQKGITLIALVITIIVMSILAGVTLSTLLGNNGILKRVEQAKSETVQASIDELRKLTQLEASTNLEDYKYLDTSTGKEITIIIPAKCAVSQVEGENTLQNGLVIIDANGNEWVWIEVPKTEDVYINAGINLNVNNITDTQCNTIYNDLANYTSEYKQEGYEDTFYSTEQSGFTDSSEYNNSKNNIIKSIYKYGGFWIGRYEVGDASATINNTTRTYETGATNKPVIQINQIPYNLVTCKEAQELSAKLSLGTKTSTLMLGIQWNLTCKFLELKSVVTQNELNGGDEIGSTNWGNYSNSLISLNRGKYNTSPNPNDGIAQWLNITRK